MLSKRFKRTNREISIRRATVSRGALYTFPQPVGTGFSAPHLDRTAETHLYHEAFEQLMKDLYGVRIVDVRPNVPLKSWSEMVVATTPGTDPVKVDQAILAFARRYYDSRQVVIDTDS